MKILKATIQHLDDIVPLFNGYRQFYKQQSNLEGAKAFIKERLTKQDTIIFVAYEDDKAVGFTHLFHSFTSISMCPMYILNDLFVDANYRKQGIGVALLNKAKEQCKQDNYKFIALQTETNNPARHLYKSMGWKKDKDLHFLWLNDAW